MMKLLKNKFFAIGFAVVVIVLSSLYGLSKRPMVGQTGSTNPGGQGSSNETEQSTDPVYERGKAYYDGGDYESAIKTLREVSSGSASYDDAQLLLISAESSYRTAILDLAKNYVEKNEYTTAIRLLNEGLSVISDDLELEQMLTQYTVEYETITRTEAIESARISAESGDYAAALQTIQSAIEVIGGDAELNTLLEQYTNNYRNLLIAQAHEAYSESGYEAAITVLIDGLRVLENDAEILQLKAEYEACAPISYYELLGSEYYYDGAEQSSYCWKESDYDTFGNIHQNIIYEYSVVGGPGPDMPGHSTRLFIDGKFKLLTGTLYFNLDDKNSGSTATVSIWGDEELLLKEECTSAKGFTEFKVDLTGVIYLRINITTGAYPVLASDPHVFAGISELNLYQNVME